MVVIIYYIKRLVIVTNGYAKRLDIVTNGHIKRYELCIQNRVGIKKTTEHNPPKKAQNNPKTLFSGSFWILLLILKFD